MTCRELGWKLRPDKKKKGGKDKAAVQEQLIRFILASLKSSIHVALYAIPLWARAVEHLFVFVSS